MKSNALDFLNDCDWVAISANLIIDSINEALDQKGCCSIMLTGGRSAEKVYRHLAQLPSFKLLSNIDFYFGDERCVASNHQESNYMLAHQTLFANGLPPNSNVYRMEADSYDIEAASQRYDEVLPGEIDVLLLSVGEDGHIASLFPNSDALFETKRRVLPVKVSKFPFSRLTVTPPVLINAKKVFVLAIGQKKRLIHEAAMRSSTNVMTIPACLVLNHIWIFGEHSCA